MAFVDRFKTKLVQAVTDAEKTPMDPVLKEGIRQFDETRTFGDNMKDACKEALPAAGSSSKMTKMEALGSLMKQAGAKYGLDKPEAQGLNHGGDLLLAIGKLERELLQKVDHEVYTLYKSTSDFNDGLKKEKTRLENTMTDMDGAKIKAKSGKDKDTLQAKVQSTTHAYQNQKANVEKTVSALSEHRDKQRQAAKTLAEALHEFYTHATEAIDQRIGSLG